MSINEDDHRSFRAKWKQGDCAGTLEYTGEIRFSGDLRRVVSMSSGAVLDLTADDGSGERSVRVTSANGTPVYRYKVGGRDAAWDAAGQNWFAAQLLMLARRAGFAMEERVAYLMQQGGADAVLREVKLLESDYTRRRYLQKVIAMPRLSAAQTVAVLDAAADITSNYEQGQLLQALKGRDVSPPAVRNALVRVFRRMDSDYERRRALTVLLNDSRGAYDVAYEVLPDIDSDYEKAELLRMFVGEDVSRGGAREAVLRTFATMDSDYEKRRVLVALLAPQWEAKGVVDVALEVASSIDSDYERAELLIYIQRNHKLTETQRAAVRRLVEGMDSEYERGRATIRT